MRKAAKGLEITPAMRDAMASVTAPEVQKSIKALIEAVAAREEERQQLVKAAIDWLADKWKDVDCPYCGAGDWKVGTPLEISVGGSESSMSPAFPVMCGNCGQTTMVNAIVAGLVPEPGDEEA